MAKINLNKQILGLDGKPFNATKEAFVIIRDSISGKEEFLKDGNGQEIVASKETPNEILTVRKQLTQVLLANSQNMATADKVERFALFFRIEQAKDVENFEMSAEEILVCKKCLNEFATILIAGRVSHILEGKDIETNE